MLSASVLRYTAALIGAVATLALAGPARAQPAASPAPAALAAAGDDIFARTPCVRPKAAARLDAPLAHTAAMLTEGRPVTIVTLGSSSTAGAGASSPAFSYPSRLADELRQHYPKAAIKVLNRGVNGEDAESMMARLKSTVLDERPDLVIWQFGTNTLLRDENIALAAEMAERGVAQIKASGADVILLDPQYAPRVIAKPATPEMVSLIGAIARRARVSVFPRFEIMRHWREQDGIPFDAFVTADGLHHNDWGYACVAHVLGDMIAESIARARTAGERPLSAALKPPL